MAGHPWRNPPFDPHGLRNSWEEISSRVFIPISVTSQVETFAMNAYRSYKNLPSLAGICSMEQAMKPGLSVEQCVTRLKRYHYLLKRLHQIFNNRLTGEPIYEL